MKLERNIFRSQVARRMLMFFVLSTFIPIFSLAFLSYSESNDMLLKKAHHQLGAASDTYNKAIYDRLLMIEQVLDDTVSKLSDNGLVRFSDNQLSQRIRSLAIVYPDNPHVNLYGELSAMQRLDLSDVEFRHLSLGRAILKTRFNGLENTIWMLMTLNSNAPDKGVLTAEVLPDYLWGDPSSFAHDMQQCILNERHVTLFCTHQSVMSITEEFIKSKTQQIKGDFNWKNDHEQYIASYREIFLEPHFLTPRWLVVSIESESDSVSNQSNFNTIFWGSVLLSILLIMLFSMMQIRRVLIPLEKLIEGTRRLGNRDFATQVDVISSDEFGQLATSFNEMTARLGEQFETLTALSYIDQEILSGLDIDKIANFVLMHMHKMIKADVACITVFNQDEPEKARMHVIDVQEQAVVAKNCNVPGHIQRLLQTNPNGVWVNHQTLQQVIRTEPILHLTCLFILPLNWQSQMVGYISLGFLRPTFWNQEDIQRICNYADRVAVALFTKNREELLLRQARIDALTGLPNRFLFMEQLHKEIAQSQRGERKLAVLYIDLDRFKMVNDSYGHSMGDELLREAGKRFHQCIDEGDTVARLGGDEFAVILCELDCGQTAQSVAQKIIHTLTEPFIINGDQNILAASIGIAVYPQDGTDSADLMRNSDIAMYRAKDRGGNQFVFFEEGMNTEISKRLSIERELRIAISAQQFVMHYQPQVDPQTGLVRGVEALVRWNHPGQGFVSPGTFIPIAEDTGLIIDIGRIVLHEACAQYRKWLNQGIFLDYVAVNVSVKQFRQPDFFQMVEHVLKTNHLDPHCLELEITESVLMDDMNGVMAMLEKLKGLGVQLSIDDFGTGYSSMSYLEQLPFDTLKIDISFVRKIKDNGEGGTIAATIAAMAHTLHKKIVAEGVENQVQLDFLKKCDCELIQGYFYSRPLPADELTEFVEKNHATKSSISSIYTNVQSEQPIPLVVNAHS